MAPERPSDVDDDRFRLEPLAIPEPRRTRIGDFLQSAARSRLARRRWLRAAFASGAVALVLWSMPRRAPNGAVHVRTGPGDFRLLPLGDRGVGFVAEQTELDLRPGQRPALRLLRGSVRLVVTHRDGQPFVVSTDAAVVDVLGTELEVAVADGTTRVDLIRGEVEVRNPHGSRRLWPGESARVRPGEPPRMVLPVSAAVIDGPAEIVNSPRRR